MFLIVGLGNPGEKYEKTRHNIGFRVVNEFLNKNNFSDFNFENKFNAKISEGIMDNEKILLAEPQTFMNLSGKSVQSLVSYYNVPVDNLFLVHDDIDIILGNIKISKESGAGGHKGIDSVIENLSTKNFIRFRIGILPEKGKPKNVENFVLQKFKKEEEQILKSIINKTVEAIESLIQEGSEKTMSKYN